MITLGVASIFRPFFDVTALWHRSNVSESSSKNFKLFFSMTSNSNRIIWSFILKEKQVFVRVDCFLASAEPVENLWKVAVMKKWVRERKKKQLSTWSIMNINNFKGNVRIKFVFSFYFMSFWPVQIELQHIEILHFW